jgi:hypothetical protein
MLWSPSDTTMFCKSSFSSLYSKSFVSVWFRFFDVVLLHVVEVAMNSVLQICVHVDGIMWY